jgi:alanine-synthesizing transaminase
MQFSKRGTIASETSDYFKTVEQAKAASTSLCDLTQSNPTLAGLPYESEQILAAFSDAAGLSYEPTALGARSARNAVASLWAGRNVSVAPDQVLLTSGTSEAYGYLFKLLCDPGDEVLVPEPSYPLFSELARYESVRLVPYRLAFDGAFHIDFDSARSALGAKTRALIAVSPNNPTGTYVKANEWQQLFQLGLPIISDEVFAAYPLTSQRYPSVLEVAQTEGAPLVFALDGLSKYAGLPQVKVAWLTVGGAKAEVRAALHQLEYIADSYLSVSAQAQLALPRLLQVSHVTRNAILSRIHRNLACARSRTANSAISLLPPEGGWSIALRLPDVMSDTDWTLGLLKQHQVLTQPGWFYDFTPGAVLVLSLLAPEHLFERGISQLTAHVEDQLRRSATSHAVA